MSLELFTHPRYKVDPIISFFERRLGWEIEPTATSQVTIAPTIKGSPIRCIDGREFNVQAPALPGAIYGVAALKTDGTPVGLNAAGALVRKTQYEPGAHGDSENDELGCGFFNKWLNGKFSEIFHRLELYGYNGGQRFLLKLKLLGADYRNLQGQHRETGLVLNPYMDTTVIPDGENFVIDYWYAKVLGTSRPRTLQLVAETVEQLAPDSKKLRILI